MAITRINNLGITDGTIVNADINASAAIDSTKLTGVNDAKAWVNFNGTGTVAIRASFNVSSITDGGVGIYAINFTNAFTDANYSWNGSALATADSNLVQGNNTPVNPTTSVLSIQTVNTGIATKDMTYVTVAVFR